MAPSPAKADVENGSNSRDAPSHATPIRSAQEQYGSVDDGEEGQDGDRMITSTRAEPQSPLARTWQTVTATYEFYRDHIVQQFNKRRSSIAKGKRRSNSGGNDNAAPSARQRSSLRTHPYARTALITLGTLIVLLLALIAIEAIHLFVFTLSTPSQHAQSQILDTALIVEGPDAVQLLNISEAGIQVRIDARMGLDPDRALDIWLADRSWWKRKDRQIVEWALNKVGGVKVDVGQVTIREPDWRKQIPEEIVDLLPHNNGSSSKAITQNLALSSSGSSSPQPLFSFDLEPLYVPFPQLLRTSGSHDAPLIGGNSTRRARLTMQPLNLTLLFKPASPAPFIASLVEQAVRQGNATLDINVASLSVRGLTHKQMKARASSGGWNIPSFIRLGQNNILHRIRQAIPHMDPGSEDKEFLNLTRYDFFEIKKPNDKKKPETTAGGALGIKAFAEAINPLGSLLKGSVKYRVPFGIFLPVGSTEMQSSESPAKTPRRPVDTVLLAAVASEPFDLAGQDKVNLIVKGRVIPPPPPPPPSPKARALQHQQQQHFSAQGSPQEDALSGFLSRFLRGEPNTVYVRGGSPFASNDTASLDPALPGTGSLDLPEWMTSALSVVDLPISFPGSKVTELIKNVTLSNLNIQPHPWSEEKLLFSGTINGEIALPGQLKAVDVQIKELWPDILVFDGAPPSGGGDGDGDGDDDDGGLPDDGGDDDDDDDDALAELRKRTAVAAASSPSPSTSPSPIPPPPSPLPSGAFGRVRPHTWVPATTYLNATTGKKYLQSNLTDVPFTILPGRSKEFRAFTWKLITAGSKGVETGIQGASRVHIWNSGLGELEIEKLPVEGVFMIGGSGKEERV